MTQVNVQASEALSELEAAALRMAATLGEIVPEARARLTAARDLLDRRMGDSAREIARLEDRIRHADEDEDTSRFRAALSAWSGHRDEVRREIGSLQAQEARLHSLSETLARIAEQGRGAARAMLARKISELEAYMHVGLGPSGGSTPATAGTTTSAGAGGSAAPGSGAVAIGLAAPGPASSGGGEMRREVDGNLAWILPSDVPATWESGELHWNRISPETASATLGTINAMREVLPLSEMRAGPHALRDRLEGMTDGSGQRLFGDQDLAVFDLYFGSDAIRLDSDGAGGLMVVNGRHRLTCAAAMGNVCVPVSVSNSARRILEARGTGPV